MIYADSSFLVALKVGRDTFHEEAIGFYERWQVETWLWSPSHGKADLSTHPKHLEGFGA